MLKRTKALAKTKCRLLIKGSGYGFFEKKKLAAHLEFTLEKESLEKWQQFMETGILHQPNPQERPDEFWDGEEKFFDLEPSAWACHALGGAFFMSGEKEEAIQ